ncbi:hypothetical protein RAS1_02980 [Phycisphaerae bacterium RAS1]|nr:hypothetical protein RAS1_02980 [Phycisphaerae bacterium RAS1]
MLIEVHTGFRPGRPALLVVVAGVCLSAALGLAWLQVQQSRALAPETEIPGTPLRVRAPRNWIRDPRDPASFILTARDEFWGRPKIERRVSFNYRRLPEFRSPMDILRRGDLIDPRGMPEVTPAKIGKYDAVQVRQVETFGYGRERISREKVFRLTCLPRGHLIYVEYVPLTDLTLGDLALLDDMCAAVRVDDPAMSLTPAQAAERAGIRLSFDPAWQLAAADFDEVAGFYLCGAEGGLPTWSLGVFRTWLAGARTPDDLLADVASDRWLLGDEKRNIRERSRADGARIVSLRRPPEAGADESLSSVWLLGCGAELALIVYVFSDAASLERADAAAAKILEQVELRPIDALPPLQAADEVGRELVRRLSQKGALPRWGARRTQVSYRGQTLQGAESRILRRTPLGRNAERGYEGAAMARSRDREEAQRWSVDGRAECYEFEATYYYGSSPVHVRERKVEADGPVTRLIRIEDGESPDRQFRFTPGPSFVSPAVETVIEGWVARAEHGACLIEVSLLVGTGTAQRMLRPLPPDPQTHQPRVLVQTDYWPLGGVLAFDEDDGETAYEVYPTSRYERVES